MAGSVSSTFAVRRPIRIGDTLPVHLEPFQFSMSVATETPVLTSAAVNAAATASLTAQLKSRVLSYFPHLDKTSLEIRLVTEARRVYSAFYEFHVSDGARSHGIIVKIPFLPSCGGVSIADSAKLQRPRLFGLVAPHEMAELEFRSLAAIRDHILATGDDRFGSIRPLELLSEPSSVVMEKSEDASMRLIHHAARRVRMGVPAIPFSPEEAIKHAALWLREFHRMAPLPQTLDRMAARDEFLEAIAVQTDYLIGKGENKVALGAIRSQLERQVLRFMPAQFDLATSHGDYALRNLLVSRGNQVTVIDTLARWRSPKYEDVASFLLGLNAPAAQVVSFGLAYDRQTLRRFSTQFLTYYFEGETIPRASIHLFELLLLLDRWGAFVQRVKLAKGPKTMYAMWRLTTLRRFLFQYFRHTFRDLEQLG